jgi:hypothetical protein
VKVTGKLIAAVGPQTETRPTSDGRIFEIDVVVAQNDPIEARWCGRGRAVIAAAEESMGNIDRLLIRFIYGLLLRIGNVLSHSAGRGLPGQWIWHLNLQQVITTLEEEIPIGRPRSADPPSQSPLG